MDGKSSLQNWPDEGTRRRLIRLSVVCLLVVVLLGALQPGSHNAVPADQHQLLAIGALTVVLPVFGGDHEPIRHWYLVILGDWKVFVVGVAALVAVAWRRNDPRLALLCLLAPVFAEVVVQCIGKPTFFRLGGGRYGYPSGHVTAATAVASVALVVLRRLRGRAAFLRWLPVAVACCVLVAVGVVVANMHSPHHAVAGLFSGVGAVAFWAAMLLRPVDESPKAGSTT